MQDREVIALFTQGNVIFSRTSPQDKLRIVTILKDHGHIVAVT
jgi:magnesium-transporting ATPase (P-type)